MASRVSCPRCGERFEPSSREVRRGRATCPECDADFTIEADDRPRKRSRDEEEDRPRKGRSKDEPTAKKRKRLPPVLIVAGAAGFLVLLVGVGLLIYFLGGSSGKGPSRDLLSHAPADAQVICGYDIDELSANDAFRKNLEKRAPGDLVELDRAGLRTADLSRVLVARTINNGNTCVVRFKNSPDQSKYLQPAASGKNYSSFVSLTGNYHFGYFADSTTLVLADLEPAIQTLREKGAKAKFSGDMQAMLDKVRGPAWRATARINANDQQKLGATDDGFTIRAGPSAGTAAWLTADGRFADVRFEMNYENASQAKQGAASLRGLFILTRSADDFGRLAGREGIDSGDMIDIRRGYEAADVSESGTRVTARVHLPASEAIRAIGSVRN
jgi:hypothetical protein